MCAAQVQPNGDNIGIVVYAHNSCSTFACHIWILKKGSILCCQVLNLRHNLYTLSYTKSVENWFTSEHCPRGKFSQSLYFLYCLISYEGSRWIRREKMGNSGHFVDYTSKGINSWLPYSQSPRPYAICRETVYSIMLRLFRTIQSFIISRQLLLWCFQYYFLLFLFCSVPI